MRKIIYLVLMSVSLFTLGQKKPFTKFCHSDEMYPELVKKIQYTKKGLEISKP